MVKLICKLDVAFHFIFLGSPFTFQVMNPADQLKLLPISGEGSVPVGQPVVALLSSERLVVNPSQIKAEAKSLSWFQLNNYLSYQVMLLHVLICCFKSHDLYGKNNKRIFFIFFKDLNGEVQTVNISNDLDGSTKLVYIAKTAGTIIAKSSIKRFE